MPPPRTCPFTRVSVTRSRMRRAWVPHLASAILLAGVGCSRTTPQSSTASVEAAPPSEHIYRTIDGVPLRAFVFKPAMPRQSAGAPAILLFHGGGWVAGAPDWTFASAQRYAALGMVAISVEYRLSRDGVTPIEALEDVCGSFRWARAQAQALALDPR